MNEEVTFQDVKDQESWEQYIWQEAYEGAPEKFGGSDQWHDAEQYIIDSLTKKQLDHLETIGVI